MQKTRHLQFLDGFRAAAALLVVTHHAWLQSWPYLGHPELKPTGLTGTLTGWLAFGKIAVTAFIVISGFCLMLPVVRYGKSVQPRRFFMRRCGRILPPYYIALGLAILLDYLVIRPHAGTIYDGSFPVTEGGILSHLFLVQNFSSNPYQINAPFWSIAVEFQIYLFFPFFVWTYKRHGLPAMLALTTVSGFAASSLFNRIGLQDTYSHYIVMFGFGMCAAHYAFALKEDQVRRVATTCYALLPCLLLAGLSLHHQLGSDKLVTDTLVGMCMAICLTLATLRPDAFLARSLSAKPLAWLGTFSYSFYLIHYPLQQILWQVFAHPAGWSRLNTFLFMSSVGTACIIAVAFGFFYMFERPFLAESKDGKQKAALAEIVS